LVSFGHYHADLPEELSGLTELALDLRWTWSHGGDALWRRLDAESWERTRNPWAMLQSISRDRLAAAAKDRDFVALLRRLAAQRLDYLSTPFWCDRAYPDCGLRRVAYFSLEYGLGEALPLYAGGLGILAGDHLKTASDLGVPLVGIGLLYQQGYYRQVVDDAGVQRESYPYNDPMSLPVRPVAAADGGWVRIAIGLPGRTLLLRAWRADAGRVPLFLLDSNDPLNGAPDRGITSTLYGGGSEQRLMQEVVLGIGGWRLCEALDLDVDVCHLNEGHAAFAVLERARSHMKRARVGFWEAFWATRAGNVFTTHTAVDSAFDRFGPALIDKYFPLAGRFMDETGITRDEFLGLGRANPKDAGEPFNLAYLAARGCHSINGVSRLHGGVSRQLFRDLYPRWPSHEIPVEHVTNGVHVPSWDSSWADNLWENACGRERWRGSVERLTEAVAKVDDESLWSLRARERAGLVAEVRQRLARHVAERGGDRAAVAAAESVFDPNALTLGFARRFTGYKRADLLLRDAERLVRLLADADRPAQIVVAGKAHPDDAGGKRMVLDWVRFSNRPEVRRRAVFLEDYDIALAQELVQGVDVWINTPRRPWEACGTSGMKVLVNGGLNASTLDGWWAEAYSPEVGWKIGDGDDGEADNARDAESLYSLLEREIVPEFYARDAKGVPRAWVARIRASMAGLMPRFSSNRMLRDYLDTAYVPAAREYMARTSGQGAPAAGMLAWRSRLARHWGEIHFGQADTVRTDAGWAFSVAVYLGAISPDDVRGELYADPTPRGGAVALVMRRGGAVAGATNGFVYSAEVGGDRRPGEYTARVVPFFPGVRVPLECPLIAWQR
jgi:starch phosphorylase